MDTKGAVHHADVFGLVGVRDVFAVPCNQSVAPVKGSHCKVVGIAAIVNGHELVGDIHFDNRVDLISVRQAWDRPPANRASAAAFAGLASPSARRLPRRK